MALLLFVVALGIVDEINDDNSPDRDSSDASVNTVNTVEGITLVALTAKFLLKTKAIKQQVAQGECEPTYDCFQSLGEELVQGVVAIGQDIRCGQHRTCQMQPAWPPDYAHSPLS